MSEAMVKRGGEAVEHGVVEEVFREHRLSDPVRSDEHDVGRVVDEGKREQLLDERSVDAFGPVPVEVGDGLEGADARVGSGVVQESGVFVRGPRC